MRIGCIGLNFIVFCWLDKHRSPHPGRKRQFLGSNLVNLITSISMTAAENVFVLIYF